MGSLGLTFTEDCSQPIQRKALCIYYENILWTLFKESMLAETGELRDYAELEKLRSTKCSMWQLKFLIEFSNIFSSQKIYYLMVKTKMAFETTSICPHYFSLLLICKILNINCYVAIKILKENIKT